MLNRRTLLTSTPALALAVATPAGAAATGFSANTVGGDDSALFAALADYGSARAEFEKAQADLEWLVAEWRHLWPLAPEELLGGCWFEGTVPNSRNPTVERDIGGRFLKRDTALLTKRLDRKTRAEHPSCICDVTTADYCAKRLADLRSETVVGRTAKSLARNRLRRAELIRTYERRLALATAYETETARLRELSGVEAVLKRIEAGEMVCYDHTEIVLVVPVETMAGLQAKADFYMALPHVAGCFAGSNWKSGNTIRAGWLLSQDIARLRETGAVAS